MTIVWITRLNSCTARMHPCCVTSSDSKTKSPARSKRWLPVNRERQPCERRHVLLNCGQHIRAHCFIKSVLHVDMYKDVHVIRTVLVKSRADVVDD
jgi:hypothetical protein